MDVISLIKLHEGFRSKPYYDSRNILTIGYGMNIDRDGPGISEEAAAIDLKAKVAVIEKTLSERLFCFDALDPVRQAICIDMAYNLGWDAGFWKFKKMIAALNAGNFVDAAQEMKNSAWYNQVGHRSERLYKMMLSGRWPDVA